MTKQHKILNKSINNVNNVNIKNQQITDYFTMINHSGRTIKNVQTVHNINNITSNKKLTTVYKRKNTINANNVYNNIKNKLFTSQRTTNNNEDGFSYIKTKTPIPAPAPTPSSPIIVQIHYGNEEPTFTYSEYMLTTHYHKTQIYGHCLYLVLHQLYIKYLQHTNSIEGSNVTFNRITTDITVSDWYQQAIEWDIPTYSLQLQIPAHQQHYRLWLLLLYSWLISDYARNRLTRVINYFDQASENDKHYLHYSLWGTDEFIGAVNCPFPFYLLSKQPGIEHYVINQVYGSNQQIHFRADYTRVQLTNVISIPYVIQYAMSHYFLPDFIHTPNIINTRLNQLNNAIQTAINIPLSTEINTTPPLSTNIQPVRVSEYTDDATYNISQGVPAIKRSTTTTVNKYKYSLHQFIDLTNVDDYTQSTTQDETTTNNVNPMDIDKLINVEPTAIASMYKSSDNIITAYKYIKTQTVIENTPSFQYAAVISDTINSPPQKNQDSMPPLHTEDTNYVHTENHQDITQSKITGSDIIKMVYTYSKNSNTKYFRTKPSRKWLEQVLEQHNIHMDMYPNPTIKSQLSYLPQLLRTSYSKICKCDGAFATCKLYSESVIGIMSGRVVHTNHSHAILIKNKAIAPINGDPWSIFSKINEYIWDDEHNNVEFKANGLIVVKKGRTIQEGEELFVNYSDSYNDNWDHLREQNMQDIPQIIIQIATQFPHSPPVDELKQCLSSDHISPTIQRLIRDFCYGGLHYPLFPIHDYVPPPNSNIEQWIELVLRCRWTYKNFCFRRIHKPEGWCHPTLELLNRHSPIRKSSRLSLQPLQRYGGMDDRTDKSTIKKNPNASRQHENDDGIVPLTILPDITKYEFLYQTECHTKSYIDREHLCGLVSNTLDDSMLILGKPPQYDTSIQNDINNNSDYDVLHNHIALHEFSHTTLIQHNSHNNKTSPGDNNNIKQRTIHEVLKPMINITPKRKLEEDAWQHAIYKYNLRIAGLNVDGCDHHNYYRIFQVMDLNDIDILLLVDTRITAISSTIRQALSRTTHKYRILFKPQENIEHKHRVGGTLVVYNERIQQPSLTKLCPAGSTSIFHFTFGRKKMHAILTYWPQHNDNEMSLWSRMMERCDEEGFYNDPIEYIKTTISSRIIEFTLANESCFVFGDFNTDITKLDPQGNLFTDKYDLHSFITTTFLHHSSNSRQLNIQSYGGIASYESGKNCSRIDYQFHNGCHIKSATCFPNDTLFDISSRHRILFASYELTEYSTQKNKKTFINNIRNLNMQNEKLVDLVRGKYIQMYENMQVPSNMSDTELLEILNDVTAQSVEIVQKVTKPHKPKWNVYSPEANATFLELQYVRKMYIHCYMSATSQWSQRNYKDKLDTLLYKWKHKLWKHTRRNNALYQQLLNLHSQSYGILYWTDRPFADIKRILPDAITIIKKRLHCNRRKSMRLHFNNMVKTIETERVAGKIKTLINLVLGAKKKPYLLDYIIKGNDTITNEHSIAQTTKDFFENDWFKALPEDGTHISNNVDDWTIFELPFQQFQTHFQAAGIPTETLSILHRAIQHKPTADKQQQMNHILIQPPTYEEFIKPLKKNKDFSVAGWSGLSYNMIKIWPDALKKDIFNILLELWNRHITPEYWKIELIHLIPKSDLPEIDKLRPITLLETLRKMWYAIISNRINEIIAAGGYIHHSQHGCLKRVGVDEANLGVINQYESSKELTSDLFVVFWDKRRAFDRPPKPALFYSLLRIGVPQHIANSMIQLGIHSTTYIKTPVLMKAKIQKKQETIDKQAFIKETGTPQGDTPSALMWNLFEDILLVALSNCLVGKTSFLKYDGGSICQQSSAFVDDLTSFRGTYEGIQAEADIISAFCIIYGIELSLNKLQAIRIQWGNEYLPGEQYILVHTAGWAPHRIPLVSDGAYKTLGMTIDSNPVSFTQFNIVRQQLQTSLALVMKAPVSNDAKITIIKSSIFPKVIYTAKLAAWTLQQFRDIDKIFSRVFRKLSNCMKTLATELIYMTTDDGGLGFPMFSLICNKRKMNLLMRMDQQLPYRRAIAQSLLGRGARAQGIVIPVGHGAMINAPLQQWWITSLLQELAELNLSIKLPGHNNNNDIYQWRTELPTQGKLAYKVYGEIKGISLIEENTSQASTIPLRTAQVWMINSPQTTEIKEIIGFTDNYKTIQYMVWTPENTVNIGAKLKLSMHNNQYAPYPVGAYGTHSQSYEQFFPNDSDTQLLLLSNEQHSNSQLEITANIISIKTKIPSIPNPYIQTMSVINDLIELGTNASAIYTDGGYDPHTSPTTQGGVVVIQHDSGVYTCVNIIADVQCRSVFPIELVALATAKIIATNGNENCTIYSDSEASIQVIKNNVTYHKNLINYYVNNQQLNNKCMIKWVQSHVETRKPKWKDWTPEERGNYIADRLALRNWSNVTHETSLLNNTITVRKVLDITMSKLISILQANNSFSITSETGLFLGDIETTKIAQLSTQYLSNRDLHHQKLDHSYSQNIWRNTEPSVLKWTHRPQKMIHAKSLRMKIIYNKHWTADNCNRYTKQSTVLLCPNCGEGNEDQPHIILHCKHKMINTLRKQLFININQQIEHQKKVHPTLSTIIDFIREQAYSTSNHQNINIWTGLWSKQQINDIQSKLTKFKFNNKYSINTIYKLSRIYTDVTTQLYRCRGILKLKKDQPIHPVDIQYQVVTSMEQITEYFENDNQSTKNKKRQQQHNPSQSKNKLQTTTQNIKQNTVSSNDTTHSTTSPTLTPKTTTTEIEEMSTIENVIKDTITDNNYSLIPKYYSIYANSIYKKRTMQSHIRTTNHSDNPTFKKPRQQSTTQMSNPIANPDRHTKTKQNYFLQSNSTSTISNKMMNHNMQQENIDSTINILPSDTRSKRKRKQLTVNHNHNPNNDFQGCTNLLNTKNIYPLQNSPNKEPEAETCMSQERVGIG